MFGRSWAAIWWYLDGVGWFVAWFLVWADVTGLLVCFVAWWFCGFGLGGHFGFAVILFWVASSGVVLL